MTKLISLTSLILMLSACAAENPSSRARNINIEESSPTPGARIPEGDQEWLSVYKGSDAFSADDCYLYIKEIKLNENSEIEAIIASSYKHELYSVYQQGQRLVTQSLENGELIRINYHSHGELDLHFESFNFKMLHGDHFHNESCEDLHLTSEFPDLDDHDHDHGHH